MTTTERFFKNINKTESCWLWTGALVRGGYGRFYNKCLQSKIAHRCSYELHKGKFDKKLQVCHHCDNPQCVNPSHLFLGTNKDNYLDSVNKGRAAFQTNVNFHKGINSSSAKLNDEKVIEIRKTFNIKNSNLRSIAKMFNVNKSTISRVLKKETWNHI